MSSAAAIPPYPFHNTGVDRTLATFPPSDDSAWPAIGRFKVFTLVFVLPKVGSHECPRVLLGKKQRGAFTGIWNGFGGKVDNGDASVHAAALRELEEEAGILATDLVYRGRIVFGAEGQEDERSVDMRVFSCSEWEGEITASEEMGMPTWFSTSFDSALPIPPLSTPSTPSASTRDSPASSYPPLPAAMHLSSPHYLPLIFGGKSILARFDYDTLQEDGETGTWKGPRRWWIGELAEDGNSGQGSEWPQSPA